VLTYANQLTILRMVFVPCFVMLLIYGHPTIALLIFFLAGVTDAFDGFLARALKQKTVLGSFLDPVADKLLLTSAFITLTIPWLPVVLHIPAWLTILAISRDVLIAVSALIIHLQTGHTRFPPSFLGKCTTALQLLMVGDCLLANLWQEIGTLLFQPLVYVTLLLTVSSGLHYFYRSVKIIGGYQRSGEQDGEKRVGDS
jgi:cardiolipin synthase